MERVNEDPEQQPIQFQSQVLASLAALQSSMTTMAQRVAQLEESETAHSASDHEMTQSVDNTEGEQSSVEKGQRPPKTSAHAVSGANVEKLHLQSTPLPLNWADRNLEESVDYTANITWPEEDEDESRGVKLFKISKRSDEFLAGQLLHTQCA